MMNSIKYAKIFEQELNYVTDKKYAIYYKSPNELSINDGYFKW